MVVAPLIVWTGPSLPDKWRIAPVLGFMQPVLWDLAQRPRIEHIELQPQS